MKNRRKFLLASSAVAGGAYINWRGLRYPRLSFEPAILSTRIPISNADLNLSHLICVDSETKLFRAIAPEPKLKVALHQRASIVLTMNNISPDAQLKITQTESTGLDVNETKTGIDRTVHITSTGTNSIELQWAMPEQEGILFAVIGDTGAGAELGWCLQRAKQLNAQFLLHLGDFNYVEGEYERAIELFSSAPLPCYISIGNHDFNDSGLVYPNFLNALGPLNHAFTFAGTRFLNIDTAADFFPAYSGQRGAFLRSLNTHIEERQLFDQICFTHRNFIDPRPGRDHTIGRSTERKWLADTLSELGVHHILTGHVHRSAELDYRKLRQYTVGEGLGFEDIVHEKQVAQLLIGRAELGKKVSYSWEPLSMPWAKHTSPKQEEKLRKEHSAQKLQWYRNQLALIGS